MANAEQYLRPEVIRQVSRLDLKAKFIVEGFLSGLHASPYHGFSVEFSEHRKYVHGDDIKDIDWTVYAKTEKYYVKKFEAETNLAGYLAMDLSESMDYPTKADLEQIKAVLDKATLKRNPALAAEDRMTKFEYAICLAAALGYLMIHQQDSVGLVTFDTAIRGFLPPRSKRTQLGAILGLLANLRPVGKTDVAAGLHQLAAMIKTKSLVILFSDLIPPADKDLNEEAARMLHSLHHLRHRGNEVIVFHVLDATEVHFPFEGLIEFANVEAEGKLVDDGRGSRDRYLEDIEAFRAHFRQECFKANIDYVPVDTSINFDKALMEYLQNRQKRF